MSLPAPKPGWWLHFLRLWLLFAAWPAGVLAQTEIDTMAITARGDSARFWVQIPTEYDPSQPPAILIWWHQLGGTQYEMRDYTEFDTEANLRGWIAASHFGSSDRHWNATRAQEHVQTMLDWIRLRYPFHMDSIYMIGGSMGGAAGQVWHDNHCGEHDYFIAATAGGSQILDCQLRQEQYLASGDTNRSMRATFGGLPSERDSVAFEYHRASAIFFADTTQSMHFNSLHLPAWSTWGNTDGEQMAYGDAAVIWDSLRRASGAEMTYLVELDAPCHGLQCMWPPGVCDWLRNFTANRYPNNLSINADENGEYYWTYAELAHNDTIFGRYGVVKRPTENGLDITLVRNVQLIRIDASVFNLHGYDTLSGIWQNLDAGISDVTVALAPLPSVAAVYNPDGYPPPWSFDSTTQTCYVSLLQNGLYRIMLGASGSPSRPSESTLPRTHVLVSAFPNPFNALTTLSIESIGGPAELLVYDLLGRLVRAIPLNLHPGHNRIPLDAQSLGSGEFFVQFKNSSQPPLKIILLR